MMTRLNATIVMSTVIIVLSTIVAGVAIGVAGLYPGTELGVTGFRIFWLAALVMLLVWIPKAVIDIVREGKKKE
ncbi:MAG: hypothetical protein CEN87_725 [Parcubacteria group bacterium Licking1014_1]|nr:MAG: hypothetical protein CEN87_725 [Parcubacteria group bacterium Licking1014_1]